MKDSGIEWIGQIPESWNIGRTKHYYSNHKTIAGNQTDSYERLALTLNGVIKRSKEDSTGLQPEAFNGYQVLRENELVFKLIDLENISTSRVGLSPYTGIVSPAYIILEGRTGTFMKYGEYFFLSMWQRAIFNQMGDDGVRSSLNASDLLSIPYTFPPLPEQLAISAYLDRQCALIDSVTEKTKASIEEYKKLRQAVITQAVTKGVRGDRPMKDSGIEWIGEIPEEWDVVRLKFILSEIVDCPHETPNYTFDGDYYVIRTADEDYGFLRSNDNMYRLNDDEYQNRIRRLSLDKDDIVYGREGERWGLACLVPDSNKYCLGQRMMQFRCKTDTVYPLYLKWALNSWSVYIQGCFDTLGSTSPHVNISTIINYYIPMPCYEEQIELAEYMESKSTAINALITKKETFLAELEAYKKSLIYEYVTGKKEVPQP